MALVRWDPFRSMTTLQDRINQIYDNTAVRSKDFEDDMILCACRPAIDLHDNENAIVITAELPGVDKKDISVEIKDNIITLKGEKTIDNEVKEENFYRKERCFGSFHRAFTLPAAVKPDMIKAHFRNGILKVEIPKPEEEKPRQIAVNIE